MRIIVTAGGTMGHINPALAIIDEFKKQESNLEVLYIGTTNRMEEYIIPEHGIPYEAIEIYGLSKNIMDDLKNIPCVFHSIKECKRIIKEFHPDVVIGVGGYVTYPVIKAAHDLHIKTFIHEQNSIPGKTNRWLSKYVDCIGITFDHSKNYFAKNAKIIYTGHPCGAWALKTEPKNKLALCLDPNKKLVTVVAGSLGSMSLNDRMAPWLLNLKDKEYEVAYITGNLKYDEFKSEHNFPKNVRLFPYVDEVSGLMKVSDVVISRAGAGSLSEIVALEIPAIIIPSPNVANNHQYYNALDLKNKGCIELLEEKDITVDKVNAMVSDLLYNKDKRKDMIDHMDKLDTKDSAYLIYKSIKDMIK